jgi:hypothetical protein
LAVEGSARQAAAQEAQRPELQRVQPPQPAEVRQPELQRVQQRQLLLVGSAEVAAVAAEPGAPAPGITA